MVVQGLAGIVSKSERQMLKTNECFIVSASGELGGVWQGGAVEPGMVEPGVPHGHRECVKNAPGVR